MSLTLPDASAIAACNAVADAIDGGSPGRLVVYNGDGTPGMHEINNAVFDAACANPAFGNAALVSNDIIAALASAVSGTGRSGPANRVSSWFAFVKSDYTIVFWGTVTATGGGGDLELQNTTIGAGASVTIDSYQLKMPRFVGD